MADAAAKQISAMTEMEKRLETLVGAIHKIAKRPINPDWSADLERLLFEEYKLVRPRLTLRQ